jgi:hypothetical protein
MLLPACGSAADDEQVTSAMIRADARQLEEQGYLEQAAMLADGEITEEEHQNAFDLVRGCLEESGGGVAAGPYVSPVDGWTLEFLIDPVDTGDPIESGEIEIACEERYYSVLSYNYVHSREPRMDPPLRSALIECLGGKGFEVSGEEKSVRDFAGGEGAEVGSVRDNAVTDCIHESVRRLYPDREVVGGFGW